jgi:Holliday junction DNA helicase RuvB
MFQQDYDALLRPTKLSDVIGMLQTKTILKTVITAAKAQRQPVGHILLTGAAGLGKTTLAHVIANEMQAPCWATTGTNLATQFSDCKALNEEILPTIRQGGVVFVDEIHRTANLMQDTLLPLLERNWLAVRYRAPYAGYGFRKGDWVAYSDQVRPFTFIGATTRSGLLQDPFRDRFKLQLHLDFYDEESMFQIVRRSAWLLELGISDMALRLIAQRSKGTPRVGNNHVWYAKQWSIANHRYIDVPQAEAIMAELGIDSLGLTKIDRRLLAYLIELDRPAGLATIAAYLAEDRGAVESIIEPPLIRAKLLIRTARGRTASKKAKQHLERQSPQF